MTGTNEGGECLPLWRNEANPRRLDCPPDSELIGLAEHPKEADPFIPQHLTCCSPCFNRYMEILADLKRRKAG